MRVQEPSRRRSGSGWPERGTKTDDDTERRLVYTLARAIVFITSTNCYLLAAGTGYICPFLLERSGSVGAHQSTGKAGSPSCAVPPTNLKVMVGVKASNENHGRSGGLSRGRSGGEQGTRWRRARATRRLSRGRGGDDVGARWRRALAPRRLSRGRGDGDAGALGARAIRRLSRGRGGGVRDARWRRARGLRYQNRWRYQAPSRAHACSRHRFHCIYLLSLARWGRSRLYLPLSSRTARLTKERPAQAVTGSLVLVTL